MTANMKSYICNSISIASLILAFVLTVPVQAGEEDVAQAYSAYQNAMNSGDLRAALPHAERAVREAAMEWGANTPQTYPYVAALAEVNNDLFQFREAANLMRPALEMDQSIEGFTADSYGLYFQTARALRGLGNDENATTVFNTALHIAETRFDANGVRAGRAHLELARTYRDTSHLAQRDETHNRLIGSGYLPTGGDAASLQRAEQIFSAAGNRDKELQILQVIRAAHLLGRNDIDGAGEVLEPAIEALVNLGYMDDYVLGIYVDWIANHLTEWPTRKMERMLMQAIDYGKLRNEGPPIPVARGMTSYGRRACIDDLEGRYGIVKYSVDANGQIPRTEVIESNWPNRWDDPQRQMMRRSWIFIPAQQGGETVRVDGLTFRFDFSRSNSC